MRAAISLILTSFACTVGFSQSFTKLSPNPAGQVNDDTRNVILTDLDNNSYPDIHYANRPQNNHAYFLNFRGQLTPAPAGNGLSSIQKVTGGAGTGDFNGDCYPDFLLANGSGGNGAQSLTNSLFKNDLDGNFIPEFGSGATSRANTSSAIAMIDYDRDGDLDIYVSNSGNSKNELYQNIGGSTFLPVDTVLITSQYVNSRTPAWCDYDNDGDLDLFLPLTTGNNRLYRNDDTSFFQVTSGSIVQDGGTSFSASWGDYNGDGKIDLYVTNSANTSPNPTNFLYKNLGNGSFQKITGDPSVTTRGKSSGSVWFDMDNDGDLDLFTSGANGFNSTLRRNYLYQNNGNGSFTRIGNGSLVTDQTNNTGVACGDIDKDGDIDLLLGTRAGQNEIYLNDHNNGQDFLNLNLLGTNGKANAYHAKVKIKCNFDGSGSRWEYRRVIPIGGNSAQSSPMVHFGLGSASQIDSLVIDYISGGQCVFTNLTARGFYNVDPANCQMDTILKTSFSTSTNYLTASFTDSTTGPATSYQWDFGDGDSSNAANPTHTYAAPGSYTVCLATYDNYCKWDSVCTTVEICPDTSTIGFLNSNVGTRLTFTDTSTSAAYAINWDFGDNTSDSGAVVTHSYSQAGTYQVCLTLTDSCRSKQICRSISVCNDTLIANFGSSGNGYTWTFSDSSLNANTITWDFGDGSTAVGSNPSHTFNAPGSYYVCQTVQDICTSTTFCDTVEVCTDSLNSNFSYSGTGRVLNFSASVSNATSFYWDFGDGDFSTQQNPAHAYLNFGTYTVCLAVSNDCYSDTICQQVVVCNQPGQAAFSTTNTVSPLVIQFNDQSQNAVSYEWDFGDGSFSTKKNPLKAFNSADTFNVCLTIIDSCGGQDSTCQVVDLTSVSIEEQGWISQLRIYPNPTSGEMVVENPELEGRDLQICIFDLQGKKMMQQDYKHAPDQSRISLAQFPEGIYLLQVKSKGVSTSRRILKH